MRKSNRLVEGVGITDVAYSPVATKCPYYRTWQAMLIRCYSPRSLKRNPTYVGCFVNSQWHRFSVFKEWMQQQDWQGKQLDKDILIPGNREYGPNTCIFIASQINSLLSTQPKQRGQLPLGVTRHGDRFKVTFKKNRRTVHVGVYATAAEAAIAYQQAKADWIEIIAAQETCSVTKQALIGAAARYRKGIF